MRKPGWSFWRHAVVLCAGVFLSSTNLALGQKTGGGSGAHPSPPTMPPPSPSMGGRTSPYPLGYPTNLDPAYGMPGLNTPQQVDGYRRFQQQERQKRIVKDTDKLLALTAEYQRSVQQGGQTPETDRKLRDIEKLAREVRVTVVQ